MTREKPGCRTLGSVTIVWLSDHRSRRPVLCPLRNCVDKRHVWPNWASRCKPWRCMLKDINIRRPVWQGLRRFEAYCQLPLYDVEKEMQRGWALAAMRAAWVASSLLSKVHCESKKTLNSCSQLHQILTDFQTFSLTDSVVNFHQTRV